MKPATLFPFVICLAFLLAMATSQAQPLWTTPNHQWVDLDDMNQLRSYFPTVAAGNGRIYAFGGTTSLSTSTNKIEEYDIGEDSWAVMPYSLPQPMCAMAAVYLDGAIYLIGGADSYVGPVTSKVYRFFPETGFDADTIAPLPSARGFLSASVTPDGKIFAIGGSDDTGGVLNTVDVYDPSGNSWAPAPSLNIARAAHTSVVVGNKIYVMGGTENFSTGLNSVEVLDLDNPGAGWVMDTEHRLLHARALHGSAVVFDNVVITLGGIESNTSVEMSVEGLAPAVAGDTSEYICDLQFDRRAFGCVSDGNYIYIMGGNSGNVGITSTQRLDLYSATRETPPSSPGNPAALLPNTPNPFDLATEISFKVTKPADIRISIFDATGQLISTPVSGWYGTGEYHIPYGGAGLEAGIYFCVLNSNNAPLSVQKWVVVRQ